MIDRIEELLGSLAAEDEEEREDVPARPVTEENVPVSPRKNAGRAGAVGAENGGSGGQAAGEIMPKQSGPTAGELWKDGPVWTVRRVKPETVEAQETAAERTAQAGKAPQPSRDGEPVWAGSVRAAPGGTMSPALENVGRGGLEQAGLGGLYRQAVRGLRPAAPARPQKPAERTAREPGSAASLAVDELDRAVRRDSRRYDGGMSIY